MLENNKLEGMIVYCMLEKPVACYDAEKGNEYKCGVVVDEDTADAFAERYPKQAARKVKRTEFAEIYKTEPPEGTEKNLYVITLKKNSQITDKKTKEKIDLPSKYKPRVMQKQGNTLVDITNTVLPANGSMGIVSFEDGETKFGIVARLKNVLITEMIEYQKPEGSDYEAGDEFSDVLADAKPAKAVEDKPKVTKPKVKQPEPSDDDLDSDLPF